MQRRPAGLFATLSVAVSSLLTAAPVHAVTDAQLQAVVAKRLNGDRTGACFATAVIDGDQVSRAYVCADGEDPSRRIDAKTAFEIGSVTKTMTAALLADLIREGKASLDDPLSAYLPAGSKVPDFEGKPILLRHIVTHTSGLPSIPTNMIDGASEDPYAHLGEKEVLNALAGTALSHAPGTHFEYSNFATMLLSYAVARRAGSDFETLLDTRVFTPLGMQGAYINRKPEGIRVATGHLPTTAATSAWNFKADFAGVGGVRATLDDMVRYVQAQMSGAPTPLDASLRLSRQPVATESGAPMAMHWMLAKLGDRTFHSHEGGTGGFSAFVAFDTNGKRGVVILSDTALHSLGGLGTLGLHLLDEKVPLGKPRKAAKPKAELLDSLVGEYDLQGMMKIALHREGDTLVARAEGQPDQRMGYDDAGDFYPLAFDALLTPQRRPDGRMRFLWQQGGGQFVAERLDAATVRPAVSAAPLEDYVGEYPLMPKFSLSVRKEGERLMAQATGQGAFALSAVDKDVFEFAQAGIVIRFRRDTAGKVIALDLEQGGQTLKGDRK